MWSDQVLSMAEDANVEAAKSNLYTLFAGHERPEAQCNLQVYRQQWMFHARVYSRPRVLEALTRANDYDMKVVGPLQRAIEHFEKRLQQRR